MTDALVLPCAAWNGCALRRSAVRHTLAAKPARCHGSRSQLAVAGAM